MEHTFRTAQPLDATVCATIIRDWGAETPWMTTLDDLGPMTAFWTEILTKDSAWVAENNDTVVGFCVRKHDNISALYLAKSARGLGAGKVLLDLAKADRDWITVWAYEKNSEARRFYRREGLVEVSRELETYDDGVSLIDVEHRWTRQNSLSPAPRTCGNCHVSRILENGRGGEIRTHDPLYPKQVRYQTAPRPDSKHCLPEI